MLATAGTVRSATRLKSGSAAAVGGIDPVVEEPGETGAGVWARTSSTCRSFPVSTTPATMPLASRSSARTRRRILIAGLFDLDAAAGRLRGLRTGHRQHAVMQVGGDA